MPSLKELKRLSFQLINGQISVNEAAALCADWQEWPFAQLIQLLKEHGGKKSADSKNLEPEIFRYAHSITNLDLEECREDLLEFNEMVKVFLSSPQEHMAMATWLNELARKYDLQDIVLMIDLPVSDFYVIHIPDESKPLYSDELLARFEKEKKELEALYGNDIIEACRLVDKRIPVMLSIT